MGKNSEAHALKEFLNKNPLLLWFENWSPARFPNPKLAEILRKLIREGWGRDFLLKFTNAAFLSDSQWFSAPFLRGRECDIKGDHASQKSNLTDIRTRNSLACGLAIWPKLFFFLQFLYHTSIEITVSSFDCLMTPVDKFMRSIS